MGTIVRYEESKGYGFIVPDDQSEDIFFLRSELPPQLTGQPQSIIQESKVEFEVQEMPDGKLRARALVLLEPAPDARGVVQGSPRPSGMAPGGHLAVGRIVRFDKTKGFGFIESADAKGDIFFLCAHCPQPLADALNRGEDCRDFEVEVETTMKDGKPRATRVMPLVRHHPPPPMPMPMPMMAGRGGGLPVERGMIVNFDTNKGFGFVKPEHGGEDCFVMRAELPREIEGRSREDIINCHIEYEVKTMPDGKTRAQRCVLLPPQRGGGGGGGGAVVGGGRRVFRGIIRQFNNKKGYGFIEVPGEPDVFLLPSELPVEFREHPKLVGMEVAFEVHFTDDGKPRAKHVNVVPPGMQPGFGMPPPPPPFAGGLPPPPMGMGMMGPPMMGMMGPPMMGHPMMGPPGMPGPPGPPPPMPMGPVVGGFPGHGGPRIRPGEKLQGRIARFYPDKGYGFLSPDDVDEDIFFLRSEMPQEIRDTQRHEDAVGRCVKFQVQVKPDGKLRAQRMSLLGDDQVQSKREKDKDRDRDAPLPPLEPVLIEEMVDFLVERGGGCDYGKFASIFTKVKKQQLKEHFDICSFENGQRIELPADHPARPEGMGLEEPELGEPQDDDAPPVDDDAPLDDDELSIPPGPGCTPVGRIKNYDPARGFGFIVVDGKPEDIYFPRSALPTTFHGKKRSEMPELNGVEVAFEEDTGEQKGRTGMRASKVNLLLKWEPNDDCFLLRRAA